MNDTFKYVLVLLFVTIIDSSFAQANDPIIAWNYGYVNPNTISSEAKDYFRADSIASLYKNYDLHNLKLLTDQLTYGLETDHEKFRAIYKWICENIEYDIGIYAKNERNRIRHQHDSVALNDWNEKINAILFNTLLNHKRTVCTGYAYLVKKMANIAGIPCEIIHGYGRSVRSNIGGKGIPNHSWNSVQLEGKWYLCDATWSSGYYISGDSHFYKQFQEGYFLTNKELFIKNHYPLKSTKMMNTDDFSLKDFLNGPLVYRGAFNYGINPLFPSGLKHSIRKGEEVEFRFHMEEDVSGLNFNLQFGSLPSANPAKPKLYQISDHEYAFKKKFKSRGVYVMHLKISDEFICTYEIIVK